jgi:plasmid stability protein
MPSLTLKNMPDALLEALRESAATNRRSLNQEVTMRLERSLEDRAPDPEAMLAELRAWRRMHDVAPVTEAILRKAREGRP